ncbi:MAG TPA: ATP synthase F0 subunit B [Polyangiaceae bacterium]|jgi:F-type H+-transporting ATPase subunit b|nr:ATP synthase F0 subunit B [Polyangiaceae bacterium]
MVKKIALALALALALTGVGASRLAHADEEPASKVEEAKQGEHAEKGEHEEAEQEFNWAYGFFGEKEGVEPSIAYRPKGMPAPFLANILNAAILFAIIVVAGKKPIAEGLRKRKERIVQGMEEAGRMKADAQKRLGEYEDKLKHLDSEIERIRTEMRQAAETERRRVLQEAKERRERMERDAHLLVEQESKAARETLSRETVQAAVRSAQDLIANSLSGADREKLSHEYFETLRRAPIQASGGRS